MMAPLEFSPRERSRMLLSLCRSVGIPAEHSDEELSREQRGRLAFFESLTFDSADPSRLLTAYTLAELLAYPAKSGFAFSVTECAEIFGLTKETTALAFRLLGLVPTRDDADLYASDTDAATEKHTPEAEPLLDYIF